MYYAIYPHTRNLITFPIAVKLLSTAFVPSLLPTSPHHAKKAQTLDFSKVWTFRTLLREMGLEPTRSYNH